MRERGRPTAYKPDYARIASKACELGATDKDLASMFDVSEQTINAWKKAHPDFLESLKSKELANYKVEQALFKRATGYSHKETKVLANTADPHDPVMVDVDKHYAPDTGACVVWLANRDPGRWKKDPGEVGQDDRKPITINLVNPHADSAN